ncbi:ras-interacting protein RIP3-like [Drosophila ficusphila]|uniref:ras-interacting protein RIP3-like n=1 Tax=Drosophila ficusphila TaxID=30025 RepID=UPI001C8AB9D7|nr:ras-interacting protein RIP3-like [Drosophila ficusphila]
MVVCRFFQQGSCRYGTKCHNEHFDVKQYLKADMESSLNGKMWPFSAYGPFKDKANFPNFIEDQSFEEVRFLCYEAKRLNSFDQFAQQFNREVMEATNKMKTMLQMSPQILDVMIKIHEAPEGGTVSAAPQQPSNPFAAAAPATNSSASIFGKPTLSTGNIFGNVSTQPNNANSIFGGSMATANPGNSIFGGGAAAAGATSVFGQPQQQQPQPAGQAFQGGNLFAQAQVQPANPSPFGGFQQQQQPQAAGIFGQPANTNLGIFGQAAQQQAQAQPPSGLFAQAAASTFPNQQQQLQQQQMQQQQMQQQQQQQMQQQQQQQMQQQQQQQLQMQQQQQQMMQQQQMLQQQQQPQATNEAHSSVYSRMADLNEQEIEAFKADQFLSGALPFKPPPRELC